MSRPVVRKSLVVAVVVVVVAAVAALLADVATAIRSEHRLSVAIAESPRVPYDPEVTLAGFPFLTQAGDGRYSGVTIAAKGVELSGCEPQRGVCRAELGATLGSFDGPEWGRFSGSDVLHTSSITAYTRLDAVTLARFMRITDLTLSTPAPDGKAGGGGPQDGVVSRSEGVVLTGTVALPPSDGLDPRNPPSASDYDGPKVKVSVAVDLSVTDGALRIRATDFYTGPERHVAADVPAGMRAAVLERFSMTLPRLPMAWGVEPERAESFGGDIQLVGASGPAGVRPDEF